MFKTIYTYIGYNATIFLNTLFKQGGSFQWETCLMIVKKETKRANKGGALCHQRHGAGIGTRSFR